jgi:hypothetical protein
VYVQEQGGVNLYDYPVAAGAPFACHLALNVSQAAAALQRRPLAFLRQDKRTRLGIEDRDMSAAALALYSIPPWKDYSCHSRISASEKTFTGWAIPHSAFALEYADPADTPPADAPVDAAAAHPPAAADQSSNTTAAADLFAAERQWRAGRGEKPARLFSVQRRGFENWCAVLLGGEETAGYSASTAALLRERIAEKNTGNSDSAAAPPAFSVSATDLNEFFKCPVLWLYRRIFHLEPHEEDAALLDDEARGLLYHKILHLLFERIKTEDAAFTGEHLDRYFEWIEEISNSVLRGDQVLRGPLVYPLLAPLAAAMNRRLQALLKTEARYFSGCAVDDLEQRYDLPWEFAEGDFRASLRLTGRIDRVSLTAEGPVIIDYKTNTYPAIKHCRKTSAENSGFRGVGLEDFQIPMYIKLYETCTGKNVDRACFVSINRHKYAAVVGELPGGRDMYSRERYEPSLDALEEGILCFSRALGNLDFDPSHIPGSKNPDRKTCVSCEYKTICRSLYSLNPGGKP